MLTYSFRCAECREPFELEMHTSEYDAKKQAGIDCSKCHSKNVHPEIWGFEVKTSRKTVSW